MNISKINAGNSPRLNKKGSVSKNQNVNNTKLNINNNKTNSTPAFKGLGGLDTFCLGLANLIENGGLFVSFTLQDMLGTNLPRPIMGLKRNSTFSVIPETIITIYTPRTIQNVIPMVHSL